MQIIAMNTGSIWRNEKSLTLTSFDESFDLFVFFIHSAIREKFIQIIQFTNDCITRCDVISRLPQIRLRAELFLSYQSLNTNSFSNQSRAWDKALYEVTQNRFESSRKGFVLSLQLIHRVRNDSAEISCWKRFSIHCQHSSDDEMKFSTLDGGPIESWVQKQSRLNVKLKFI